jgi:Dynamin family
MPTNPSPGLSAQLKAQREARQRKALDAIDGLAAAADRTGLPDAGIALRENADGLQSDNFKMIVVGRFKNGKSTLINALLGGTTKTVDLAGAKGPMVVDDLPATAVLSEVNYADTPDIRAVKMNGQIEQWTLASYLANSTLDVDEEENLKRFALISQFQIGFPAKLCQSNVTLYDSPGLDESPIRTRISMTAARRCDTAIMVFGSRVLMGKGELDSDEEIRAEGTHMFVVINVFDRLIDDKLRAYTWNKYVKAHLNGGDWKGQELADFARHNVYFVNAKMAADARYALNGGAADHAYVESGLAAFEQRLTQFLITDRLMIHLSGFAKKSVNLSNRILQAISQKMAAVTADRDRFKSAWVVEEPKLKALRAHPTRLPRIIDSYRNDAIISLQTGATALIAGIRRDLPEHLEAAELPSQSKVFAVAVQKKLMREAVDEINAFITRRVSDWMDHDADKTLRDIASRLGDEVAEEVTDLGRKFDAINVALTGWDKDAFGTPGNVHSVTERVTSAIRDLLFGDLTAAGTGGAGGWRGAAGGIAGALGASWLLIGVLGITSGLVLVPILAIAALFRGLAASAGLARRIKREAAEEADKQLALLPSQLSAELTSDLTERFEELKKAVGAEVTTFIDEQVHIIEDHVQTNQQQEAAKEQELRTLQADDQEVRGHRKTLQDFIQSAAITS